MATVATGAASLSVVPPRAVARSASAGSRRPLHVVVAVGMTAGLYAVSLAGVTMLQGVTDARLAAERAPAADAVAALKNSHDAMESQLTQINGTYASVADKYKAVSAGIVGHEKSLQALGSQVKKAVGSASALNMPSISYGGGGGGGLPSISSSTVYVSSKPAAVACTTASGKPC